MAGRYAETPAPGPAGAVAEAAWAARFDTDVSDWLVLPDGCVDLVVTGGRPAFVAGPATRPSVLAFPAGAAAVGVRLRPGAAAAVLGVGAHELRDCDVPVDALPAAPRLAPAEQALAGGDVAGALRVLVDWIGAGACAAPRGPDPLVLHAAARLRREGRMDVAGLSADLAISARQLRRRFGDHVGYGPRRFARIARLQRVLARHRARPDLSGAALAADAGYADQAHLARDCRELAGRPLGALLGQRDAIG